MVEIAIYFHGNDMKLYLIIGTINLPKDNIKRKYEGVNIWRNQLIQRVNFICI